MNIVRRRDQMEPFGMSRMLREFMNDPFFAELQEPGVEPGLLPIDVVERDDELVVLASLPGFRKDEIDVQVHNGMLTINAEHSEEQEEQGERYHRRERRFGAVSRMIPLPAEVREDQCQAELKDGVLTLTLPKTPEARPRRIQITEGGQTGATGASQKAQQKQPQNAGNQPGSNRA